MSEIWPRYGQTKLSMLTKEIWNCNNLPQNISNGSAIGCGNGDGGGDSGGDDSEGRVQKKMKFSIMSGPHLPTPP